MVYLSTQREQYVRIFRHHSNLWYLIYDSSLFVVPQGVNNAY